MIQAGNSYKITHDIVVGDQIAFRSGETVAIEAISPNPQKPEYKNVVLSPSLNQRFQLRDVDLAEIGKGVAYPAQPVRESTRRAPQEKTASSRKKLTIAGVIIAVLIVLAVGGFVAYKMLGSSSEESAPSTPKTTQPTTPTTSQIGPQPDLSKPDPNASGYQRASQGNPITKAQYDLLKGGMSSADIGAALGESYGANFLESVDASGRKVDDYDWTIKDDPQGYVKAKLVDNKLVEKSWNPSTGEPSWEVYSSTPSASTPSASQPAVSQIGPKPDLTMPPVDPTNPSTVPGNPITKAQYDLLKGGMSLADIDTAFGPISSANNTFQSTDASGRTVVDYAWPIEDDPQGYVKAKLVYNKLVEKSWNPSTGEPSWEVY